MPLTQVSARFFLELAVGLFVALAVIDRRAIGAGFSRLMAAFVLAALIPAWLLARAGGATLPSECAWLAGGFLAATLLLLVGAGRLGALGEGLLMALGSLAGGGALLLSVHHGLRLDEGQQVALQLASCAGSTAVLGGVTGAMIFGHWYLVTPDLPVAHLGRLTKFAALAVYVKLALLAATFALFPDRFAEAGRSLAAIVGFDDGGASFLVKLDFLWLLARIAVGLLGTVILLHMTLKTIELKATQPATGILYAATVMVLMGELFAFVGEKSFRLVL